MIHFLKKYGKFLSLVTTCLLIFFLLFLIQTFKAQARVIGYCGDGICSVGDGESCSNCPTDCGQCAPTPTPTKAPTPTPTPTPVYVLPPKYPPSWQMCGYNGSGVCLWADSNTGLPTTDYSANHSLTDYVPPCSSVSEPFQTPYTDISKYIDDCGVKGAPTANVRCCSPGLIPNTAIVPPPPGAIDSTCHTNNGVTTCCVLQQNAGGYAANFANGANFVSPPSMSCSYMSGGFYNDAGTCNANTFSTIFASAYGKLCQLDSTCELAGGSCNANSTCGPGQHLTSQYSCAGSSNASATCCLPDDCAYVGGSCAYVDKFGNYTCPSGTSYTNTTPNTGYNWSCDQQSVTGQGVCCLPPCTSSIQTCTTTYTTPTNTCYKNNSSRTCQYGTNPSGTECTVTNYTDYTTTMNCSNNYACNTGSCTTYIIVHAFRDDNHNGTQDTGEPNLQGVLMNDNGYTQNTNASGNATDQTTALTSGTTASIDMSVTNPFGGVTYNPSKMTKSFTLNNTNGGSTINYAFIPVFSISGYIINDANKNGVADAGEGLSGWTVAISGNGINATTISDSTGLYIFSNLTSGSYTVTLTQALPNGYSYISSKSFNVTVGIDTCNVGGSTMAQCNQPAIGDINPLNFSVTNENAYSQPVCGDARYGSGYSQLIPSTANCNGTSGPYAIIQNSNLCPNNPGILFSGSTDPQYGTGTGASTTGMVVGDSLFPENFTPRIPNTNESSYSFVTTTLNNLSTPATSLTSICPSLINCVLSESTPGGVYTTTAADGPVNISISNLDGTSQLGATNYTFVIGGDLTFSSNVALQNGYTAVFVSGGNIHVNGNVGETDWNSLTPDLEGFFSADSNLDVDAIYASGQQCQANGQPKEKKLNIKGAVVTNAAGNGGSVVDNRDGCVQDLYCPTVTFTTDPIQILHAPGTLKPPYTFWKELNP